MQLPLDTQIAGKRTVGDWLTVKPKLAHFDDQNSWVAAIELFEDRIQHRYIKPALVIKNHSSMQGEGFAVMTIVCSLIEYLETTYQGINYRFRTKQDPKHNQFEYGNDQSQKIMTSFLTNRSPFNTYFNKELADLFYKQVRCALLHEARTKGKWNILAKHPKKIPIFHSEKRITIYRDHFLEAINTFIISYKDSLLISKERQEAFIRKFDNLCIE